MISSFTTLSCRSSISFIEIWQISGFLSAISCYLVSLLNSLQVHAGQSHHQLSFLVLSMPDATKNLGKCSKWNIQSLSAEIFSSCHHSSTTYSLTFLWFLLETAKENFLSSTPKCFTDIHRQWIFLPPSVFSIILFYG